MLGSKGYHNIYPALTSQDLGPESHKKLSYQSRGGAVSGTLDVIPDFDLKFCVWGQTHVGNLLQGSGPKISWSKGGGVPPKKGGLRFFLIFFPWLRMGL